MNAKRRSLRVAAAIVVIAVYYLWWKAEPSSQNPSFVAHFLHAILFGWIRFAKRVFPEVNVALAPVAFALFVSAIIWALLYVGGKRWWGWTWRMPLVLICAPALVFAIVLASAGIQQRANEIAPDLQLHTHRFAMPLPPPAIFQANFEEREQNDRRRR